MSGTNIPKPRFIPNAPSRKGKQMLVTNKNYPKLLEEQIKQSGQWLIDNAAELVAKIKGITDYTIEIDLENGDKVPVITIKQSNVFFDWEKIELEEKR